MSRPTTRKPKTRAGAAIYAMAAKLGSMDEVANKTGLNRSHLFDLATGLRSPSLADAQALKKHGIKIDWWDPSAQNS